MHYWSFFTAENEIVPLQTKLRCFWICFALNWSTMFIMANFKHLWNYLLYLRSGIYVNKKKASTFVVVQQKYNRKSIWWSFQILSWTIRDLRVTKVRIHCLCRSSITTLTAKQRCVRCSGGEQVWVVLSPGGRASVNVSSFSHSISCCWRTALASAGWPRSWQRPRYRADGCGRCTCLHWIRWPRAAGPDL